MVGSPSSSEARAAACGDDRRSLDALRSGSRALALVLAIVGFAGCVTVRPSEKEFLSDPSMTFGDEGTAGAQEQHVMTNREGSFGAGTVSGGGCGCN